MDDTSTAIGFVSHPVPGGATLTLTTLLGLFLRRAEEIAGPRITTWTILGIEFFGDEENGATPQVWFPGNSTFIAVRLTRNVALEPMRAIFQLAHEACHLIAPVLVASNLEEGFATKLGHEMAEPYFRCPIDARYQSAHADVSELLSIDQLAIRKIREIEPVMSQATAEIVSRAVPEISAALAERLCRPWRQLVAAS